MNASHPKLALEYFQGGYSCAQSVFLAYGDKTGLSSAEAARLMSGFGGGIGKSGGFCGALAAAVALLGLAHGREQADQMDRQQRTYALVRHVMDECKTRFGSVNCRELLGGDILAPGVKELARDEICPGLLTFICGFLDEYAWNGGVANEE